MTLQPVVVDRFGGLNLTDDPSEVGFNAATSLLNVDFDQPGIVRSRTGFAKANAADGNGAYHTLIPLGTPHQFLALYNGTTTVGVDRFSAGVGALGTFTAIGSLAGGGVRPNLTAWTRLGTATASYVYLATVTGTASGFQTLQRYDGTSLAASTGAPKFVTRTPWDNRLVQARYATAAGTPSGANGTDSTVFFSDPGAPDTYTATNWVQLTPGDGEAIVGVASWGNAMFVFKRTTLFVFYSTGGDATGGAVFNYRTVSLGTRLADTGTLQAPVVAGEDGVYFIGDDGIYVTSGGTPARVSSPVSSIFSGAAEDSLAIYTAGTLALRWAANRLFMNYQNQVGGGDARTLVWDPRANVWTVWSGIGDIAAGTISTSDKSGTERLYTTSNINVLRNDDGTTADNGNAVASSYQSGFQAVAEGASARFRRFELTGTGTVDHATASEYGAVGTAASVTMGTAPAVGRGFDTRAARARDLSFKVSAASGGWSLSRWRTWVADVRQR